VFFHSYISTGTGQKIRIRICSRLSVPGNCPRRSRPPFSAWAAAGADSSAAWAAWAAAAVSSPNSAAEKSSPAPPTPGWCPVGDGGPAPGRGARTWGSSTSPAVEVPASDF
jgi:hypothetical protein